MNRLNRFAILLVALLVLVGAVVTLLAVTEATDPDFLPGGSGEDAWFFQQLNSLAGFSGSGKAITIVVSIVVALAALEILFLEISPIITRRRDTLQISSTPEGALTVDTGSVKLLSERTGIINRNISSLRCDVGAGRRPPGGGSASIVIRCYPRLILGSNLPEVRDDLQTRIKKTVEQLTGLTVLQVHVVRVRYDRDDSSRLIGS